MEEGLLEKAREFFSEPDMIVDLYDFTIVWMSEEIEAILGYAKGELIGKQIMDTFASSGGEKRVKAVEHMTKSHGTLNVTSKTKSGGAVNFEVEFYTSQFKDGFYHFGKMLRHEVVLAATKKRTKAPSS